MIESKDKLKFGSTKDTSYLALTGQVWSVFCYEFGENWQRYIGTALYLQLALSPRKGHNCSLQDISHPLRRCVNESWGISVKQTQQSDGNWLDSTTFMKSIHVQPHVDGNIGFLSISADKPTSAYVSNYMDLGWGVLKFHPLNYPFGTTPIL